MQQKLIHCFVETMEPLSLSGFWTLWSLPHFFSSIDMNNERLLKQNKSYWWLSGSANDQNTYAQSKLTSWGEYIKKIPKLVKTTAHFPSLDHGQKHASSQPTSKRTNKMHKRSDQFQTPFSCSKNSNWFWVRSRNQTEHQKPKTKLSTETNRKGNSKPFTHGLFSLTSTPKGTHTTAHQYDDFLHDFGRGQEGSKDRRQCAHQSRCVLPSGQDRWRRITLCFFIHIFMSDSRRSSHDDAGCTLAYLAY